MFSTISYGQEGEVQETEIKASGDVEEKEKGTGLFSKLRFGAKGGLAISSFSNGQAHTGGKLGVAGGLFMSYPLPFLDFISLQVEALYLQQGGTLLDYENEEGTNNILENIFVSHHTTRRVTLHNIDIPLVLKVGAPFTINSPIQPKLIVGPSFGFRMAAGANYERTGELTVDPEMVITTSGFEDVTSDYSEMHYGLNFGIAGEIELEKFDFFIEGRYRYGLSEVKQGLSRGVILNKANDLNSDTILLMLGIAFK